MPQTSRRASICRTSRPTVIGDIDIAVTERVAVHISNVGEVLYGVAAKEPVSIVVRSAQGEWRFAFERVAAQSDLWPPC